MADPIDSDIVDVTWTGYSHDTNYAEYLGLKRSQLRQEVQTYFGYVEPYNRLNAMQ